jgi:epoxyqueuosine reductase
VIPREAHFPRIEPSLAAALQSRDLELMGVVTLPPETADPPSDAVSAGEAAGPAARAGAASLADAAARAAAEYASWIAAGHHGEMRYLERHDRMKYAPEQVLPGCRSVVIVGMNYYQERRGKATGEPEGRIARYAWGRDYHNALGKRLRSVVRELASVYPQDRFRSFVDASPLSERFFAEHADVGYTGRNTLTISSAYGSWFFLGEILTTHAFAPTPPQTNGLHGACPSGCFRCGDVCPTGALYDHHRIDASRCISYLTIEYRGSIAEELRPLMGDWIFGCDLCQEVCPLNVRARETRFQDFTAHRAGESIELRDLLGIATEEEYRARFEGSPLRRPGRDAMVRNALIAAANTGAVDLLPMVLRLRTDSSDVVRETARWTADRLQNV